MGSVCGGAGGHADALGFGEVGSLLSSLALRVGVGGAGFFFPGWRCWCFGVRGGGEFVVLAGASGWCWGAGLCCPGWRCWCFGVRGGGEFVVLAGASGWCWGGGVVLSGLALLVLRGSGRWGVCCPRWRFGLVLGGRGCVVRVGVAGASGFGEVGSLLSSLALRVGVGGAGLCCPGWRCWCFGVRGGGEFVVLAGASGWCWGGGVVLSGLALLVLRGSGRWGVCCPRWRFGLVLGGRGCVVRVGVAGALGFGEVGSLLSSLALRVGVGGAGELSSPTAAG